MKPAPKVVLTIPEIEELSVLLHATTSSTRLRDRIRAIFLANDGLRDVDIAEKVGIARQTVALCRRRFLKSGVAGLLDEPGRGRKKWISEELREEIVQKLYEKAPNARRWTSIEVARSLGVSGSFVRQIWREHRAKAP